MAFLLVILLLLLLHRMPTDAKIIESPKYRQSMQMCGSDRMNQSPLEIIKEMNFEYIDTKTLHTSLSLIYGYGYGYG